MTALEGVAEEYRVLREGTGAYRVARDVVAVVGREAMSYLQGQLSQDVAPIAVGASAPALLLEPDGKLTALLRVTRTAEDAYALDTDAGYGEAVAARLTRFKLRTKVEIAPLDWPCVALRGARAGARAPAGRPVASGYGTRPSTRRTPPFVLAVEWNGVHGVDLLGPGAEGAVPQDARWCGEAAWEALRIEAGIPKMGAELDGRTIAPEAHLVERAVSFTKGCYTGQELVARLDARGSRVARRLCGLVVPGADAADAELLTGSSLWLQGGEKPVGKVTSAAWCPGLGADGALGALCYLHRSVDVPAALEWGRDQPGGRPCAEARALPLVA
jgi:folate-binding protein YgfZ